MDKSNWDSMQNANCINESSQCHIWLLYFVCNLSEYGDNFVFVRKCCVRTGEISQKRCNRGYCSGNTPYLSVSFSVYICQRMYTFFVTFYSQWFDSFLNPFVQTNLFNRHGTIFGIFEISKRNIWSPVYLFIDLFKNSPPTLAVSHRGLRIF